MQPYFFPYIGYFHLINCVDKRILADDAKNITKGWINRNRILKSGADGWIYIIMPLSKHLYTAKIKDVSVVEGTAWYEKILRQLVHYKKVRHITTMSLG